MNQLRLGKKPHTTDSRDLKLASYIDATTLPPPPAVFGYGADYPKAGYGMLGNDEYGDCVWAGLAHTVMLWNKAAGRNVQFTTKGVLSDYSAVTGFNPDDPNSDQGTDIRTAMSYLRNTGVVDSTGARHKCAGYVAVDTTLAAVNEATYLFGATIIGVQLPDSAQTQFPNNWTYEPGSAIDGGHCVTITDRNTIQHELVTWGTRIGVGHRFLTEYMDEAWAILSPDWLESTAVAPNGFNLTQLQADLAAL